MSFEEDVKIALKKAGIKNIKLEKPTNPQFGDLAFACFELAKELNSNPTQIAKEIATKIKPFGLISKVVAVGPYVNFYINFEQLSTQIVKNAQKKNFGKNFLKGKVLIEHTSINPNAPPHVGRARNAIIADSIVRTMRFAGYKVDVHYFVNDVGKQIAMLVYATKDLKGKPTFDQMLKHYIEINRAVLENPSLENEIFKLLYKLEKGDKKVRKLFKKVVSICIKGQIEIFKELGIKYNHFDYESKYIGSKLLKEILKKLEPKILKDSEGRLVLDLSQFNLPLKEPYVPLTRADGTSLYFLRDIAYNVEKAKWSKGGRNIVVLGEDHKLEFMQIKSALSLLNLSAPDVIHYAFVLLPEGKMSTRSGNIVLLTDFMKEAVQKAKEEIAKRHPEIQGENLEQLAKIIGYGALKYSILKISAEKNVIFSWEDALNFEGQSAPYIQYTYVRAKRILEKVGKPKKVKFCFSSEEEKNLIKLIAQFPSIVKNVTQNYEVHTIAKYAFDLATAFNLFYEKHSILHETDQTIKNSRLNLVKAYANVIKNVLYLLGIEVPQFM